MWNFIKNLARAAWNGIKKVIKRAAGFFSENAKTVNEVATAATSVVKLVTYKPPARTERVTVVREHHYTTASGSTTIRVSSRSSGFKPGYSYGRSYVRTSGPGYVRI